MAILRLENGAVIDDIAAIASYLAPLSVELAQWSVGDHPHTLALLDRPSLEESEKEDLLRSLDGYFEDLKVNLGYQSRDLIVLHDRLPNLDGLLAKFEQCHTHADDEIRYIIDGEGIFGFVYPDGAQLELTVQREDYINVPAGTEHWFRLSPSRRIKAIRYFTTTEGWVPQYTGTPIRLALATR
jgi:1,2-dihydroxy-3-keto-5-methylthiopentene dioxygenase